MFKFDIVKIEKKENVIRTLNIAFSEEILIEIRKLLMEGYTLTNHGVDLKKNIKQLITRGQIINLKLEFTGDKQYTYKHQRLD